MRRAIGGRFGGDSEVLVRLREGDGHAIDILLNQHGDGLIRLASRIVGSPDLAQDVVQEVFLHLWNERLRVEPNWDIAAYLFGLTRNRRVSLRGKIYDSATKEGLEGAVVSVSGTSVSTISKSDGAFVLVGVIPGERVLSAKLLGYKSTEIKVSVKTSTNSDIAISISASVKSLNEVVTTATGQQRRVEVANDIVKINVEEIAARVLSVL